MLDPAFYNCHRARYIENGVVISDAHDQILAKKMAHRQLVKFPCDVFGGARICVPIRVNPVGVGDEVGLLLFFMVLLIAVPAKPFVPLA